MHGSQTFEDIRGAINNLLQLGAIRRCRPEEPQFISSYFLTPKSDGSYRFVLNLRKLNEFIRTKHFKMEDGRTAEKLISNNCYMAKLDLENAYFLIPVNKNSSKYLRFIFQGQYFEFVCLPFGLNVAPLIFTKVMRPVVNQLRKKGLLSIIYLDDILLVASSRQSCTNNVTASIELLEHLGFIINYNKSSLQPSQRVDFLGITYDSRKMTLELPEAKKQKILDLLEKFSSGKSVSIRQWSSFVGSINACCPAIKYGRLYTKELERVRYLELLKNNDNYDKIIRIPEKLEPILTWWKDNIIKSSNPIRKGRYKHEIFSDASTTGWGAFHEGRTARGFWTEPEQKWHINRLELKAVLLALKSFAKDYNDSEILLRIDNTTAIAYVNKMGGVQHPNLHKIAKEIWQWCEARNIWITASYIKSGDNAEADRESRITNIDTEWELADHAFRRVVEKFGHPEIDLFATRNNTKCKKFLAWKNDPEAWAIDAFTVNWHSQGLFWAFPPFALILKTLRKIVADQAAGIVHTTPTSSKDVPDGRKIIRESFRRKGLPSTSLNIFEASLTESTHKQYAGPLKQWWSFCASQGLDPYRPKEVDVIQFLTEKFEKGAAYGSLNSMRSAISLISENNVGKSSNISRLFKGIFMLRPTKPKYDRTWDVNIALRKIEEWYPLKELTLEYLTQRLVLLLALGTAHRAQTLASIKLANIKRNTEEYEIEIPNRIKTSRPGSYQPLLVLPVYKENPKLCIASTIDAYIQKTAQLRGNIDDLFVTIKKPTRAASTATISRWIKAALYRCGINEEFTAHSTRHAVTSAALRKGMDLETIRKTAGWSKNSQVFAKYYNKTIPPTKKSFVKAIFA
ncbi:uncharacterized protein LOC105830632 [Monomorium pharaonis]|uniref:uncharacterized protein LOC105830632 n=1 Tax=Monomorium pharaonis TaxID=307658 RepID=UPI0017475C61|nr:uncharacterized protein LOC105830632 [Monomorium pharaonis]